MSSSRVVTTIAVVVVSLALSSGCKEEDTRLFDETGVWTLEKFSLDGSPYQDITQGRKNRFLLRFKPTAGVEPPTGGIVAAAGCYEQNTKLNIKSSTCVNAGLSTWSCQCFAYTFEEATMVWQEFPPGETPPAVGTPAGDGGTGDTGDGDGGGGGSAHELGVEAFGGSASTFEFNALPLDLFNSDGDLARHVFQIKADSVWTEIDINGDGTPDLEACSELCFPGTAAAEP